MTGWFVKREHLNWQIEELGCFIYSRYIVDFKRFRYEYFFSNEVVDIRDQNISGGMCESFGVINHFYFIVGVLWTSFTGKSEFLPIITYIELLFICLCICLIMLFLHMLCIQYAYTMLFKENFKKIINIYV